MSGIDPYIIVHEINTHLMKRTIRKNLFQVHPRKYVAIKAEVENTLKASFFYTMHLTEWVSNIFHDSKKHSTIRVCINFWDLKKDCPKDNFPTLHINQIINNCDGSAIFPLWMDFSTIIRLRSYLSTTTKTHLFSHGEYFLIGSYLSIWRMLELPSNELFLILFMI